MCSMVGGCLCINSIGLFIIVDMCSCIRVGINIFKVHNYLIELPWVYVYVYTYRNEWIKWSMYLSVCVSRGKVNLMKFMCVGILLNEGEFEKK